MLVLLVIVAVVALGFYGCMAWAKWQENLESQAEQGNPVAQQLFKRYQTAIFVVGGLATLAVITVVIWN